MLVLCLLPIVVVLAGGRTEKATRARLAEAKQLIDQQQYNEAILLLTSIVKEDPEAFDEAEKLMDLIRAVRAEYNIKYQELITALFEDNDVERAFDRIQDLQNLDPNLTSAALGDLVEDTEIVYSLKRFREIMDEARELLRQERYREAVDKYSEGFALGSESLERPGGGDIVINSASGALARLRAATPAFFEQSDTLGGRLEELATGYGALSADELSREAERTGELLQVLADGLGTVKQSGDAFRIQSDQARSRNAQLREASQNRKLALFLSIATRLVFGRVGEPPEGIAVALASVWDRRYSEAGETLAKPGDQALTRGVELYNGGRHLEAQSALRQAEGLLGPALELQSRWPLAVNPGRAIGLDAESLAAARRHLPGFLLTQVKMKEARDTEALIGIVSRLTEMERRTLRTAAEIQAAARDLEPLRATIDTLREPWREELERQRSLLSDGLTMGRVIDRSEAVLERIEAADDRVAALEISYVGTMALRQAGDLERRFEGLPERFARGVALQEGREVELEPVKDELGRIVETPVRLERYPREALQIFDPLETTTKELLQDTRKLFGAAGASQEYLDKNPEVGLQVERLRGLAEKVGAFATELADRSAAARRDAAEAESYRLEGEDYLGQTRDNLNARRYAAAREAWNRSREALDNSLDLQEDPEVRRTRDRELQALWSRIVEGENQAVVREVRQLIEEGKSLYRQGDFNGAERSLLRAQKRWADINPVENPEITLWLGFVRAAVAASTGREIPETSPLYGEMNQLYNQAVGEFDEGRRLLSAGSDRLAVERFRRAQEKLTQILKFFPYNQRARLLALRIDQVQDPDAFRSQLDGLFREAVGKVRTNPTEAYASLRDIQSIQPGYPGLERALYDAEVELGIRLPPPDPAKLAEARRLYEAANAIFQQRRMADYPTALDYVNQAIVANPDFREAIVLKDNLQVAQGAPSTILTSDDQRKLRQAEEEFLKGNYVIAEAIVDELLRRPQYRNLRQLVELKQRIQTRL